MPFSDVFVQVDRYTGIQIQFGAVLSCNLHFPFLRLCRTRLTYPVNEKHFKQHAALSQSLNIHCKKTENEVRAVLGAMGTQIPQDALSTMGMSPDTKRYLKEVVVQNNQQVH